MSLAESPTTSNLHGGKNNGTLRGSREGRIVYISRDFYATMDTQLSVFAEDAVELLSDSDRYWWLVKEPESGHSGYIPSEIVETADEHEAKLNREKNLELTRLRSSDLDQPSNNTELPWRHHSNDPINVDLIKTAVEPSSQASWSMSGFARKSMSLRSAPAVARHKKTVSFSENKPVEHHFTVEDSASGVSSSETLDAENGTRRDIDADSEVETPVIEHYYDRNIDPILDELLEREFGKVDEIAPKMTMMERVPSPLVQSNHVESKPVLRTTKLAKEIRLASHGSSITTGEEEEEDDDASNQDDLVKKKESPFKSKTKIKSFLGKFWRGKNKEEGSARLFEDEQFLRIYAGNFSSVHAYKTMIVEESATMAEVADRAVEKFSLHSDRFNYVLSLVHYETNEILQVAANYTFGTVIELAKRATLMENELGPKTNQSIAKLPRKYRKQNDKTARMCKSVINTPITPGPTNNAAFSCLASPVVQALNDLDLARNRRTDFVTHYKFVLNRWLEGPGPTTPFYMRVQMMLSSNVSLVNKLAGVIPKTKPNAPKSPKTPALDTKTLLPGAADESKYQGNIKMLVNTSMSVAELCRTALVALDINEHIPGITYDLYVCTRPGQCRDRIFLAKDMLVHDILHLRPLIDPSGLVIALQPVPTIDSKSK